MAGVLIIGDTFRSPGMRHEVPLGAPEDLILVIDDGCEALIRFPYDLEVERI